MRALFQVLPLALLAIGARADTFEITFTPVLAASVAEPYQPANGKGFGGLGHFSTDGVCQTCTAHTVLDAQAPGGFRVVKDGLLTFTAFDGTIFAGLFKLDGLIDIPNFGVVLDGQLFGSLVYDRSLNDIGGIIYNNGPAINLYFGGGLYDVYEEGWPVTQGTYSTTLTTPEPSSLILLASALLCGLYALRSHRIAKPF